MYKHKPFPFASFSLTRSLYFVHIVISFVFLYLYSSSSRECVDCWQRVVEREKEKSCAMRMSAKAPKRAHLE